MISISSVHVPPLILSSISDREVGALRVNYCVLVITVKESREQAAPRDSEKDEASKSSVVVAATVFEL